MRTFTQIIIVYLPIDQQPYRHQALQMNWETTRSWMLIAAARVIHLAYLGVRSRPTSDLRVLEP
jgi:hypothetical protein